MHPMASNSLEEFTLINQKHEVTKMTKKTITGILLIALLATVLFMNFASAPGVVSKVEIKDKQEEYIYVVPGAQFCVERTLKNKDIENISPVIVPLFSEGATLESIDVKRVTEEPYTVDVTEWGMCQRTVGEPLPQYDETECGSLGYSWNGTCYFEVSEDYSCITGYHKEERVREIVSYEPVLGGQYKDGEDSNEDEYVVEIFRSGLPDDVRALENIGYSTEFDLEDEATVRMCFKAPPWGSEIKSGRISYMTYYGSGYDYESSTWFEPYTHRRTINCDNLADETPIVINGSTGFHNLQGECGQQIVLTYCNGSGTALYYIEAMGGECYYDVANDDGRLPMMVWLGNEPNDEKEVLINYMNMSAAWFVNDTLVNDSTGNGANLASTAGDPTDELDAQIGDRSVKMDDVGDSIVTTDTTNLSSITGDWSLEAWVNMSEHNNVGWIASKEGAAGWASIGAFYRDSSEQYCMRRGNGVNAEETLCTPSAILGWAHMVMVDDGTNFTIYHNGTKVASEAKAPTVADIGQPYRFGVTPGHSQGAMANINMIRIYASALQEDNITELYGNFMNTAGYGDLGAEETPGVNNASNSTISTNSSNIVILPGSNVTIIGNSSMHVRLQMYSPTFNAYCCYVNDSGSWACDSGAC